MYTTDQAYAATYQPKYMAERYPDASLVPTSLTDSSGQSIKTPAFVESYDEKCPICNQLLFDPYQTSCGHRLCRHCLATHLQQHGDPAICPFNEEECEQVSLVKNDGSVYPDFFLKRALNRLKVFCDFKYLGCPETVPWGKLKNHTDTCTYGKVPCPHATRGCDKRFAPDDVSEHAGHCQYAPITCGTCGASDVTTCYMEKHLETCPKVKITCAHKCGATMPRDEFDDHLESCPNKPVSCKFRTMGCNFQGRPEQVKEHEGNNSALHLDIVTSHVELLQAKLSNIELDKQELSVSNVSSMKKMEEALKLHGQKISRQENILKETQKIVARHAEMVADQTQALVPPHNTASADVESLRNQLQATTERLATLTTTHATTLTTVKALQEELKAQALKYSQFDLRFQIIETASYNGTLLWKIGNYSERKADAKRAGGVQSLYSQAFYTSRHGYRMCARVYLNGDGMGLNNHLSLFFVVMRGEFDTLLKWPFRQKVTLMIMDQTGRKQHIVDTFRPDPSSSSFQKPSRAMNIASGCPMFVSHDVLQAPNSPFLQDDVLFLKIVVDVSDLF